MTKLVWSDEIRKRVRTGDWSDQSISTVTKVEEALQQGRTEDAAGLTDYFLEEIKICYDIYKQWSGDLDRFLANKGVLPAEIHEAKADILKLIRRADGAEFSPEEWWTEINNKCSIAIETIRTGEPDPGKSVDDLRENWRQLHDRYADYVYGMLTFVARRLGEERLVDLYRFLFGPYFGKRYMPFNLKFHRYEETLYRNLYLTFEAMRCHLSGTDRKGDMEVNEYDDRWTIEFDPCGSGGRALRGDGVEGTGPRPNSPYNFGVTQKEYDWAWNKKGVCYYCAHCCLALERLPMELWGHPVRVVEPPTYPDRANVKCKWTIYKTIEAIPEEVYQRVGFTKPKS